MSHLSGFVVLNSLIAAKTIFIVEPVSLRSHMSADIILLIFIVFEMCYVWNIIYIHYSKNSHRNMVSRPNRQQSEVLWRM